MNQERAADLNHVKARIEALLSASRHRLRTSFLASRLSLTEEDVEFALLELDNEMKAPERGVCLSRNQAGWRIEVKEEFRGEIARVFPERAPKPLTDQALETLAVIACRQPVSLAEIDATRKVSSAAALLTLRRRKLVQSKKIGSYRERLWSTTGLFLETFGLSSLQDLRNPGIVEKVFAKITV